MLREYRHSGDFQAKGLHFCEQIGQWDERGGYDFAIPVDCDELLAVVTDDGISAAREDVLAELLRLKGERRAFRIGTSLFNLVDRPGWFAVDPEFYKGFIPAGERICRNAAHLLCIGIITLMRRCATAPGKS